jgi:lipopolysaccharide transport system ATP-binding protein
MRLGAWRRVLPTSSNAAMKPIIRVQNVSKKYLIGARQKVPGTLREVLAGAASAPLKSLRRGRRSTSEDFWALQDLNFEVQPGEVVGIIGRNGAGKSTLLKILSRIAEPTTGRIEVYGRVGSLLEVGTGFHPELTGRENVYLNGSILGMSRKEIASKFDEIVAFAEIDRFLDTPVKRYSSGMYVRLAFAVAAHFEPEILIIDEVLAVGDAAFQKKCLGKMDQVSSQGRTVLFVSHGLSAVQKLCSRTIIIDEGKIIADCPTSEGLRTYNRLVRAVNEETSLDNRLARGCSGAARFTKIAIEDHEGNEKWEFKMGDTVRVKMSYRVFETVPDLTVYFAFQFGLSNEMLTNVGHVISSGELVAGHSGTAIVEFPDISLRPGDYSPYFWLGSASGPPFDVIDDLSASFPPIAISSNDPDPRLRVGYFSIPAQVTLT